MGFPTVESTNSDADNTDATTHSHTLPSSISAGDLIIGWFVCDGDSGGVTWPGAGATWVKFFDGSNGTDVSASAAYLDAAGTETGDITITTVNTERSTCSFARVSDAEDPGTQAPEISTGATGDSANGDPDGVTPTGGAKNYLFIAVIGQDSNDTIQGVPTNYSNFTAARASTGAAGCAGGMGTRALNATSEDPGAFAIASSDQWLANTIAIHPGPPNLKVKGPLGMPFHGPFGGPV